MSKSDSDSPQLTKSTPIKKKTAAKKRKLSSDSPKEMSTPKKKKDTFSQRKRYGVIKTLENSYVVFSFFKKNGFFWNHWLDRIGCRNIYGLTDEVAGEVVKEFYDNLESMDENKFKSRIGGKKIILCRKDLIDCFGMKD